MSGAKENAGGAISSRRRQWTRGGRNCLAAFAAQKKPGPVFGGAGPAKSGDHSSPEGMARTDLRRSLWAGN